MQVIAALGFLRKDIIHYKALFNDKEIGLLQNTAVWSGIYYI